MSEDRAGNWASHAGRDGPAGTRDVTSSPSESISTDPRDSGTPRGSEDPDDISREALRVQVERLRERNEELRETWVRTGRASHRRTARGLAVVSGVAIAGAVAAPRLRTLLLSLGFIGLFGAVTTYYLTPERFVPAQVAGGIYRTQSEDRAALVETLGLSDHRVYVPHGGSEKPVRLFVPQFHEYAVPELTEFDGPLVAPEADDELGLAFTPTGRVLYDRALDTLPPEATRDPGEATSGLCDTLVEEFELLDDASLDMDRATGRLTVRVEGAAFGRFDRFDHPVTSVLAVTLARATGEPVTAEATRSGEEGTEYLLTYRWGTDHSREST